jgi:hypothetical protein
MFADIRSFTALFDDVPTPETFASHVPPTETPNIEYGQAAKYVFTTSGECWRRNGGYFCSSWCDDTFPVDPDTGETVCEATVARHIHTSSTHSSSTFVVGAFSY